MSEHDLTLEEYTDFIREYPIYSRPYMIKNGSQEAAVSFIPCTAAHMTVEITGEYPYTVSGNNVDGFILTEFLR